MNRNKKRENLPGNYKPPAIALPSESRRIVGTKFEVQQGYVPGPNPGQEIPTIRVAVINDFRNEQLEVFMELDSALTLQGLLGKAIRAATGIETDG